MSEQQRATEVFSGHLVRLDLLDGAILNRLHLVGDDGRRLTVEIEPPTSGLTMELKPAFYLGPDQPALKVRITEERSPD